MEARTTAAVTGKIKRNWREGSFTSRLSRPTRRRSEANLIPVSPCSPSPDENSDGEYYCHGQSGDIRQNPPQTDTEEELGITDNYLPLQIGMPKTAEYAAIHGVDPVGNIRRYDHFFCNRFFTGYSQVDTHLIYSKSMPNIFTGNNKFDLFPRIHPDDYT